MNSTASWIDEPWTPHTKNGALPQVGQAFETSRDQDAYHRHQCDASWARHREDQQSGGGASQGERDKPVLKPKPPQVTGHAVDREHWLADQQRLAMANAAQEHSQQNFGPQLAPVMKGPSR